MKTKYQDKYKKLEQEISVKIDALIKRKGVVSQFSNKKVLKLNDENQYNMVGCNTYAVEITGSYIVGENGHDYFYSSLSLETLCKIVDSF